LKFLYSKEALLRLVDGSCFEPPDPYRPKKNVVSEGNLSRANRETSGVNIRVLFAGVFVQQLRS
jgi:hypothetical protein